uniref:histone H2A.Z-specific chaperone CHZ1-like n=1 Tax=Erigeron canadensis TaxID=72917 RepID=UPI001CB8DF93|nr:histone H2A.Z-specific chaperone CHZ1-like [Erigeron canadensis]
MASAQVDATHVEEFTKPLEETTFESQGPEKAPTPPQNIKSPYDDDDDDDDDDENDITLPDQLGKEEDLDDDDKDEKAPEPHIIEDDDEDDDDDDYNDENNGAQVEAHISKSGSRATDFSEEDDD